ncbi:MAG: hypothetical protein V3W44_09975 [Dehalococcoidales bacterium]
MTTPVWIVTVNDMIDSVWTEESNAITRRNELEDVELRPGNIPQHARAQHFFLDCKEQS